MSAEKKSAWLEYQTKSCSCAHSGWAHDCQPCGWVWHIRSHCFQPGTLVSRRMPEQWWGEVSVGDDGRTSSSPAWKNRIGKGEQLLKKKQRHSSRRKSISDISFSWITDIWLRLKRDRSVALSSSVTKRVDHYTSPKVPDTNMPGTVILVTEFFTEE